MESTSRAAPPASAPPAGSLPARHLVRWIARRRPLLSALGAALVLVAAIRLRTSGAVDGTPEASLAAVLARDRIRVQPGTVVWLSDDAGAWSLRPALFVAHVEGELDDVWYAEVRIGRGGVLLDVFSVANLTESAGAQEEQLVRSGNHVAFLSRAGDLVEALTILDLRGEPDASFEGWTRLQRLQHAITNLQETGRSAGFGRIRYQLVEPSREASLEADERGRFVLALDEGRLVVDPARGRDPEQGAELAHMQPAEPGVPGGITWVVDTVRNLSFVGPEPIEWLENRVFGVQDFWNRTRHAFLGSQSTEQAVAAELGVTREEVEQRMAEPRRALLRAAEAELGFPPPPMEPILRDDPAAGEGEWIPLIDDPFVNQYPGAPPAFAQSFIRPDAERPYAHVYVTIWDPRQVQLRIVSGTREPQSANGEFGTGYIPRDEQTLRMLVAAFNGGFQAMHGEFGMMADGRVYLPPKPWAATVAVFDDGRVGMGSWPAPSWRAHEFNEVLANRQIPQGMIEMRQNLTSMVEDGVWNPWERWWWGAAPPDDEEQTFTYRSGICLTREGFMAFFWGSSLGPEALGRAMIAARCVRAMHLDMNSGHTGFEFFRPYRAADAGTPAGPPPVPRIHEEYEYDGDFPGAPRWRVRARKAVRSMAMRFPRYLARDPRDFFYLTLRPVLPGPPLEGSVEGASGGEGDAEGRFSSAGLPHAGWPYAFARARAGGVWIVRIDPRRAVPAPLRAERHQRVLAGLTGRLPEDEDLVALYAERRAIGWRLAIGRADAGARLIVRGRPLTEAPGAGAAIGVDPDGFLVYAEGPGGLAGILARARVREAIALEDDVRLALVGEEGAAAPDGETPRPLPENAMLLFFAEEQPAAEVMFRETRPMPYSRWGYLQGQRVRYFPNHPPRFVRNPDAGTRTR
jgi:hypothetical protein